MGVAVDLRGGGGDSLAFSCADEVGGVLSGGKRYAFVTGDCLTLLRAVPDEVFDCIITSPPYFNQREYDVAPRMRGLVVGEEDSLADYVDRMGAVFAEVRRVLKGRGSLWLNLGDKFIDKELAGIPWRVALALKRQGWRLRQDIIWHQLKGTQSAKDRMRDVYEHVFHFVKSQSYYFDDEAIRIKPGRAVCRGGRMVSASGVSGRKYYEYIENSQVLGESEKTAARRALDAVIEQMRRGEVSDFRMTIRGVQRTYHGESDTISGRAKELRDKGFFLIKMKASGHLPTNIWNIVPEDKWRKDSHCAVFPEELLRIPLLSTCPDNGVVFDPFSGTGTTVAAALKLGLRGVGFELSERYNAIAERRVGGGGGNVRAGRVSVGVGLV